MELDWAAKCVSQRGCCNSRRLSPSSGALRAPTDLVPQWELCLPYILTWGTERGSRLCVSLLRAPIPSWGPTLITSSNRYHLPKAPLHTPAHWQVGFLRMNVEWIRCSLEQHTNLNLDFSLLTNQNLKLKGCTCELLSHFFKTCAAEQIQSPYFPGTSWADMGRIWPVPLYGLSATQPDPTRI